SDLAIPLKPQDDGTSPPRVASSVDAFTSVNTAGRLWWGPFTAQWFYHHRDQIVPVGAYAAAFGHPRTKLRDKRMMTDLGSEPRLSSSVELLVRAHANRYVSREAFASDPFAFEDYVGTWFGAETRLVITPIDGLRLTAGAEGQLHPEVTLF